MPCYIEVYKSDYTGNILYSNKPQTNCQIKQQICKTAETKYLKTIRVIKFEWFKECKGVYWYPGNRRLQPIPYCYTIPPIHFLNGTVAPKKAVRYEQPKRVITPVVEAVNIAGELQLW